MRIRKSILRVGNLFAAALACATSGRAAEVSAFVSILPHKTFVENVGGKRVNVQALVRPGQSPAIFEPTPRDMADLASADVYFRTGVPFEAGMMPRIRRSMKTLRIVDLRDGIELRRMKGAAGDEGEVGTHRHSHHHGEQHEGGPPDPHIWLSPVLAKQQARTIRDALIDLDPSGRPTYAANCNAFIEKLDALHQSLQSALEPVRGDDLFVFHPAFGYFADAYGLHQVPVEIRGKEPTPRELTRFVARARRQNVRVIFVQKQFSQASARALARAIDGAVVALDPLAEDYLANMKRMARKIRSGLQRAE